MAVGHSRERVRSEQLCQPPSLRCRILRICWLFLGRVGISELRDKFATHLAAPKYKKILKIMSMLHAYGPLVA